MRFKPLLFALPVTTALILLALWAALQPTTPPEVRLPESVRADEDRRPGTPAQDSGSVAPEPATPPAPQVDNDPRRGELWLRLIDVDSRKPLAAMPCALMPLQARFSRGTDASVRIDFCQALELVRSGQSGAARRVLRPTDERGLLKQSVRVDDRGTAEQQVGEQDSDAEMFPNAGLLRVLLPIPEGWWLWTDHNELATTLARLPDSPLTRPVDVHVRRSAILQVNVIDHYGRAVPACDIEWAEVDRPQWLQYGVDVTFDYRLPSQDVYDTIEDARTLAAYREFGARAGDGSVLEMARSPVNAGGPANDVDAGGRWRSGGFSPGRMLVVASGVGGGVGSADVMLSPGSNRVEVMLEAPLLSAVSVRVECRDEDIARSLVIDFSASPAGPAGTDCGFDDRLRASWVVGQSAPGVWECVVVGLVSGLWRFEADTGLRYGCNSVTMEVGPASHQSATILIGERAVASWSPVVQFAGQVLAEASVFVLGGRYETPGELQATFDEATRECRNWRLLAGTYSAWAPGLDPITFTLAPGDMRSDVFDIPSKQVTFSVGARLTALLAPQRMELQLNLYSDDMWQSAQEHLYSIDAQLRAGDVYYDMLSPSASRVWTLPPAVYRWELVGEDCALSGIRSLHGQAAESVLFELDQTPELCALEVMCDGFSAEDLPEVELGQGATRMARRTVGSAANMRVPEGRVLKAGPGHFVIVASRGDVVVEVSCSGKPDTTRVAACPGRLLVTPADFDAGPCELTLTGAPAEDIELAWHSVVGEIRMREGVNQMPVGKLTLVVGRTVNKVSRSARTQVDLTPGATTLDLACLDYQAAGRVSFSCCGRGGVAPGEDHWWMSGKPLLWRVDCPDELVGEPPRLSDGLAARYVRPGLPPRFVVPEIELPPGRYRVIPWEGAPEKFWVTFQVRSGEHTRVAVRGS